MKFSAPRFDVALYTNNAGPMLAFWQDQLGAAFDRQIGMGAGGGTQHRHTLRGCTIKINHFEDPLEDAPPSGYRELLVATDGLESPRTILDPDGNRITLVPLGWRGISELAVRLGVSDLSAHHTFYADVLGFSSNDGIYRIGDCAILVEQADTPLVPAPMKAKGYRYLTLGVVDVYAAHAEALAAGVEEGAAVREVGEVVRYSQLRDPDGNWLELSQR